MNIDDFNLFDFDLPMCPDVFPTDPPVLALPLLDFTQINSQSVLLTPKLWVTHELLFNYCKRNKKILPLY